MASEALKAALNDRSEPCKCGKQRLETWWESITDAGNMGTDSVRHTREACLTKTERERQKMPMKQKQCTSCGGTGWVPCNKDDHGRTP
jgi:hypothetical protein